MTYSEVSKKEYQFNIQNINQKTVKKSYTIPLYQINIKEIQNENSLIYEAIPLLEFPFDFISTKNKFIDYLKRNLNDINTEFGFIKLERLLTHLKQFFYTNSIFQKEKSKEENFDQQIILFWAYLTGIIKLLPLLLDKDIEEIFISPNTEVISIDHFKHGRINTNILISIKEKENILYRTAMENNLEINQMKPSIKGDLQVKDLFSLRITGDIQPFSYDGTILNIRKLNQKNFTLHTLVKSKSIDRMTSAFIKTMIVNGVNITIVGSPSSGKTTLQNALLLELPSYWRVFSFENTLETNIRKNNYFRFKIFDYLRKKSDLNTIFSQLLHRSPDFVNLGEIVNKEEALAWNACMSAGIPIIQTIHSNSIQGLLNRIINVFEIPRDLLSSSLPHIVIEVKYFWNNFKKERLVTSISEFILTNENTLSMKNLAQYNFKSKKMIWFSGPRSSATYEWVKANKNLQLDECLNSSLEEYQDI